MLTTAASLLFTKSVKSGKSAELATPNQLERRTATVNWDQKRTALFTILIHSLLSVFLFIAGPLLEIEKTSRFISYCFLLDTGVTSLTFQQLLQILTKCQFLKFKCPGALRNMKIIKLSTDHCFVQFIFNFGTRTQNLIYRQVQINI